MTTDIKTRSRKRAAQGRTIKPFNLSRRRSQEEKTHAHVRSEDITRSCKHAIIRSSAVSLAIKHPSEVIRAWAWSELLVCLLT